MPQGSGRDQGPPASPGPASQAAARPGGHHRPSVGQQRGWRPAWGGTGEGLAPPRNLPARPERPSGSREPRRGPYRSPGPARKAGSPTSPVPQQPPGTPAGPRALLAAMDRAFRGRRRPAAPDLLCRGAGQEGEALPRTRAAQRRTLEHHPCPAPPPGEAAHGCRSRRPVPFCQGCAAFHCQGCDGDGECHSAHDLHCPRPGMRAGTQPPRPSPPRCGHPVGACSPDHPHHVPGGHLRASATPPAAAPSCRETTSWRKGLRPARTPGCAIASCASRPTCQGQGGPTGAGGPRPAAARGAVACEMGPSP